MLSSQHYLPPLYHVLEKFALAEQLFSLLVLEHPTASFAIKTMLHAYNTLHIFHNTADPTKGKKNNTTRFLIIFTGELFCHSGDGQNVFTPPDMQEFSIRPSWSTIKVVLRQEFTTGLPCSNQAR